MRIIPVLDIKNGRVVAAREGLRDSYPLLSSRLTDKTDPSSVIDALRTLCPFQTFYIADLDALMGFDTQWPLLQELAARYRSLSFWLDQGLPASDLLRHWPPNVVPVIGTESLGADDLHHWLNRGIDFILSLDFRGDRLIGDASAALASSFWPNRVIVMSLSRVGSGRGPDCARLREFRRCYPETQFIAAGGVRDTADLDALEAMGLHAVLVASALHGGAIAAENLGKY